MIRSLRFGSDIGLVVSAGPEKPGGEHVTDDLVFQKKEVVLKPHQKNNGVDN